MKHQRSAGTWGRAIRTLGVLAATSVWTGCAGVSGADAHDPVTAEKEHTPVRLDREKLAGLGLEEYPAMSAEEVLEGGAGQRGEVFFLGDELVVGVWEADASILAITEPLPYDEFVTVLSGKLILTDQHGTDPDRVHEQDEEHEPDHCSLVIERGPLGPPV